MAASKPSVLKRERERSRDEKAARKREDRKRRTSTSPDASARVATRDELSDYGLDRSTSGDPFGDDRAR